MKRLAIFSSRRIIPGLVCLGFVSAVLVSAWMQNVAVDVDGQPLNARRPIHPCPVCEQTGIETDTRNLFRCRVCGHLFSPEVREP